LGFPSFLDLELERNTRLTFSRNVILEEKRIVNWDIQDSTRSSEINAGGSCTEWLSAYGQIGCASTKRGIGSGTILSFYEDIER
jgi:hypothetical protein